MKTKFLFPHKWRVAGYVFLLIAAGLILFNYCRDGDLFSTTNINFNFLTASWPDIANMIDNDLIGLSVIIGLLLIGFSKEKVEDEQIAQIRLESLQWAIYLNYAILIICIVAINGASFFGVLLYNVITPLLFFCIRFKWKLATLNRMFAKEGK